jgi:hypothetical protein
LVGSAAAAEEEDKLCYDKPGEPQLPSKKDVGSLLKIQKPSWPLVTKLRNYARQLGAAGKKEVSEACTRKAEWMIEELAGNARATA